MLFTKATSAKVKPRLAFEDSGKAKAAQVVGRNFIDASRMPCGRGSEPVLTRKQKRLRH
jgi:hypothetical protein